MDVEKFSRYLDAQVQSGQLSRGTRHKYLRAVKRYAKWSDVEGAPVDDIKDFLMFCHMERGNTGATVNVLKCAIGKYLSFARRSNDKTEIREWVNENFRVSSNPRDDYLTSEEEAAFRKAAEANPRSHAMTCIFLRTGLRVGEIVELDRDDISLGAHPESDKAGSVMITRKKRRDNPVTDTRPLFQEDADAIRQYLDVMGSYGPRRAVEEPALFITDRPSDDGSYRITEGGVRKIMNRVADAADHPDVDSERVHPHLFRHTVGYRLGSQGYNATEIGQFLGKQSDATRYTHVDPSRHDDMANALR